jgi:hypothetical protein
VSTHLLAASLLHLLEANVLLHGTHVQTLFFLLALNQFHLLLELDLLQHLLPSKHKRR